MSGLPFNQSTNQTNYPINEMAELTKIDMSNLSFLERGMRNCHILSLKSIADALGMDVKDFL
jgi:transcriptional regulator with XRE-family HTH domain